MVKLSTNTIKITKTFNSYGCFLVLGMSCAVLGPTLIDLTHLVNTNIQNISFVYTARFLGYLGGSLSGGVFFDMVNIKPILLTIFNIVTTITLFGIPWSRHMSILTTWLAINGICMGVIDTGINVYCLNLWGKNSAPFFQALHFMYGFGGLIAPLIAAPFLGNFSEIIIQNETFIPIMRNDFKNASYADNFPTVIYPYTILGFFSFLVTVSFFIICIFEPIDKTLKQEKEASKQEQSFLLTYTLAFLTFLLIFASMATENGFAQMLTTYVNEGPLHLPTSTGSYMTSAFWAAYSSSRLIAIFLAIKFSNLQLLLFDIFVTTLGSIILLSFGAHYEWALWVSSLILGFGVGSFFPVAVSWLDQYILVTNKIAAILTSGTALGGLVIPFAISYFMKENTNILQFTHIASCIFAVLVVVIMILIIRKLPERHSFQDKTLIKDYPAGKI